YVVNKRVECVLRPCLYGRNRHLYGKLASLFIDCCYFDSPIQERAFACPHKSLEPQPVPPAKSRRNNRIGKFASYSFFARPAKGCLSLRVPVGDSPGLIDGDKCILRRVYDRARP